MKWITYCTNCNKAIGEPIEDVQLAEVLALKHWQHTNHIVIVGYVVKPSRKTNIT